MNFGQTVTKTNGQEVVESIQMRYGLGIPMMNQKSGPKSHSSKEEENLSQMWIILCHACM